MESLKNTGIKIHDWYYPVVLFAYVLALFSSNAVRPGVVSAIIICLSAAEAVASLHKTKFAEKKGGGPRHEGLHNIFAGADTCDIVLGLWFLYNVLSGIWCVIFGMPVSVYLGELFTSVLPMVFYFFGRYDKTSWLFSMTFLISVAVIGIFGIILFITGPEFYLRYLYDLQLISKADVPTMRVRMHSVIGSTLMGFLPSIGMLVSVRIFMDSAEGKRKFPAISFFLMLFLAFMSNQRSAMAAGIFILIYLNILLFFTFRRFPLKYFACECAVAAAGIGAFFLMFNGAFLKVYRRLVSLPGSIAQRSDQWVGAANNMKSIWLGNGLGANGHRAIGFTEHLLADGGLAKLYVESGIIGTSLFIFLMLLIFKRGFSNIKETAPEVGILLTVLLMSIGSNMMSFALTVPVFYYYLGSVVREDPSLRSG